ncbi:beta-lactamase domain protein [Solidesulfovibrio carbinoliphilus subsp. oakridgensis]|uniref:Beta-lactamase domain protein n=1 Tax=Solidesulfovibrio carbinoliphilus subsp. oakridgensis TaxID=694327 RepID=G7Q9Q1_9BACT|nr:MBL fold metallo-hydrolase [Solidesulfovibrio carbinoliphilus]EHJ49167.1 beta-lactamase domain protein [Solidesulfovibrio carbinoliphilus subsp. oakridgensis]
MDIRTFPLGPLETNCHVAVVGTAAVAVDVGGDPAQVAQFLKEKGLALEAVLLTHLHCDHLYGVGTLAREFGAKAYGGAGDAFLLDTEVGAGGLMGLPLVPPFDWEPIAPGETTLLGQPCRVLATPGHSPGSLSYHFPEAGVVFVGDLLFYRSIGRTDFAGGDYDALIRSVATEIFALPPATLVYAGHGPATTVGDEKRHNPFFSEFAR